MQAGAKNGSRATRDLS